MRRTLTALTLVLTALPAASCTSLPLANNGNENVKASGLGWKLVEAKREPVYLIAIDGTECTVSKKRFAKLKRGDNALCLWRSP